MIAAPRAVGVEIRRLDALRDEPFPAGLSTAIEPAGEMWSVVMLWPSIASTRAPRISVSGAGVFRIPSKNGGDLMYVDFASQA